MTEEAKDKAAEKKEVVRTDVMRIVTGYIASHEGGKVAIPEFVNGPSQGQRLKVKDYLSGADATQCRKDGIALWKQKVVEKKEFDKKMAAALKMKKEELEG